MISFKAGFYLSLVALNAAIESDFFGDEECPCFTREDLKRVTNELEFESCRESHAIESGIGLYENLTDENYPEPAVFSVNLKKPFPCKLGSQWLDTNIGVLWESDEDKKHRQLAENCANLIRERCMELTNHAPAEI